MNFQEAQCGIIFGIITHLPSCPLACFASFQFAEIPVCEIAYRYLLMSPSQNVLGDFRRPMDVQTGLEKVTVSSRKVVPVCVDLKWSGQMSLDTPK